MTYELFKNSIGGDVADDDPLQKALWASHANRQAVGIVEGEILVSVSLSYKVEDGEDSYELKVKLETGRYWSNQYETKFGADAVFEKLVRDYGLTQSPSQEEIDELRDRLDDLRGEVEDEPDEDEADSTGIVESILQDSDEE